MSCLPNGLQHILNDDMYVRKNIESVNDACLRLAVEPSIVFRAFYQQYEGSFWEDAIPYELLDLMMGVTTIENSTMIVRERYDFPNRYLVLSGLNAGGLLVLDTVSDAVYDIDFEGRDSLLLSGELAATWSSFFDFLTDYFGL